MNGAPDRLPNGRQVFFILLGTFLAYIAFTLAFGGSTNKFHVLFLEIMLAFPALAMARIERWPLRRTFRLARVPWRLLAVSVPLGLGLGVVGDELDRMVQAAVPMPGEILDALRAYLVVNSAGDLILLVATVVFVAGIVEEMLFRGFLQGAFERRGGPVKAVTVTSMVFTMLHFNPWWTLQIFALGLALGALAWRCGSIWPGVVIHAVNNAVSLAFMNLDESRLEWYLMRGHVAPWCLAAGLVLTYAGFRLFFRWSDRGQTEGGKAS